MKKENRIRRFFRLLYEKLVKINDTPQRVALGFGLGAALGIFPGTGPIAALTLAWLLRLNRASAVLGSLLTNTWLSFVTFLLSVKIGSAIMKISLQQVQEQWRELNSNFSWSKLLNLSSMKFVLPVLIGYLIIGVVMGLMAYLLALAAITFKNARKN